MDEVISLLLNLSPEQRNALNIILTKAMEEQNRGATVFTDGSCRNQGKSTAKAGFGVFWGDDHPNNHSGKVDGLQDNNRAELYAACHAIRQSLRLGYRKIRILSDSEFVRLVIQKPQDFEKKIAYIDYHDLIQSINLMRRSIEVSVEYVKAHSGHYGNVKADGLAKIGVRTVSLEMIARYTKKIRKFAAGRAKSSGKPEGKGQKRPESSQPVKAKNAKIVLKEGSSKKGSSISKPVVQRQKRAATHPKPKNNQAKKPLQLPKPPSAAPKKSAHLKTPRSSNLASLVRSISKVSLTTTLTATQKRKQRRQRAKVLAQLDGVGRALKTQKGEVKKTTSGKPKAAQNDQNQRKKNGKTTSTK
ncbi:hypothetical protein CAEBREN_11718 [Caenorhabditis brenneri]|uniref:ribonuclease H n=1 Tax=Caenorhabditis brenneri TaxID=135651 RepID=G0P1N3_CAEBE|nr:hypothetical protein CAEBREN_11718 [Caenorhabditis brenneri]